MSWKFNFFLATVVMIVGVVALPAAATWTDCPSPYDTLDCTVDSQNVCEYVSSPSDQIKCGGTATADTIYLVVESGNLWAYGTLDGGGTPESFCCSGTELGSTIYPAVIDTYAGNDIICLRDSALTVNSITICEDISGSGNEAYPEAADIDAGADDDKISTSPVGTHDDIVDTGDGDNYALTWGGDDTIDGGANVDYLYGGDHSDTIDGGDGDDYIYGDSGEDVIFGGEGDDVIHGGSYADAIIGDCDGCAAGDDVIYGDDGDDRIKGWLGADTIYGGEGDDSICGGGGIDSLYGNDDTDCLCGGDLSDNSDGVRDDMDGGLGADVIYWWSTEGDTRLHYTTSYDTETCECYDCAA